MVFLTAGGVPSERADKEIECQVYTHIYAARFDCCWLRRWIYTKGTKAERDHQTLHVVVSSKNQTSTLHMVFLGVKASYHRNVWTDFAHKVGLDQHSDNHILCLNDIMIWYNMSICDIFIHIPSYKIQYHVISSILVHNLWNPYDIHITNA